MLFRLTSNPLTGEWREKNGTSGCLTFNSATGKEPRAYLLPLLSQPHPSPLSHFVSYFVPLSERMFDLQAKAEAEGRASEAKVWSVLVAQIWSGLSGYCHAPPDLTTVCNLLSSNIWLLNLFFRPFHPNFRNSCRNSFILNQNFALLFLKPSR